MYCLSARTTDGPAGCVDFTGMTPGSLMISQPYTCFVGVDVVDLDGEVVDAGASPAAFASADSVPART